MPTIRYILLTSYQNLHRHSRIYSKEHNNAHFNENTRFKNKKTRKVSLNCKAKTHWQFIDALKSNYPKQLKKQHQILTAKMQTTKTEAVENEGVTFASLKLR